MISPLAYVDPEAKLGKNVTVLPFAYIEKNVRSEEHTSELQSQR